MFKRIFYFFLLSSTIAFGQNWDPINSAHRYNYFTSSSFSSACIIRTDSVKISGSDSILYINLVGDSIPGSSNILLNGSQFLGSRIFKISNGISTFIGPRSFTISTQSNLGQTWLFDSINNYTATITGTLMDSVCGQLDSIKVISSSNSDTIVLSKNHGISFFKMNGELTYSLKGIQDLYEGYHIPDYSDMYNFSVGDTFEYRVIEGHSSQTIYNTYSQTRHYKLAILSKAQTGHGYSYTVLKISSDTLYAGYQQPGNIVQQTSTLSINYFDTTNNFYSGYPHQLFKGVDCPTLYPAYYKQLYFDSSALFQGRTIGLKTPTFRILSGDTLYPQYYGATCDTTFTVCENFGLLFKSTYNMYMPNAAYWSNTYLIGAIKGNRLYGHITPDWMFHSEVSTNSMPVIAVYPNPASDKLLIEGVVAPVEICIISELGILIKTIHADADGPIDIGSLSRGSYILKIICRNYEPVIKRLIKN